MRTLSDNPALPTGAIGIFVPALIAVLQSFGWIHITAEQVAAVMTFLVALFGLLTWITHTFTVPKTPSTIDHPASLQVPAPGSILVTEAAAKAPTSVTPDEIIKAPAQ